MVQSRLSRRSVRQNKKQLYYYLGAIVAVLIIAFNFGPFFIGELGKVIDTITGKGNQTVKLEANADLQPPTIDPLPGATPSARISISGRTDYPDGTVELFLNSERSDTTEVTDSQTFEFERVILDEGTNYIKVRILRDDKKSDFSDEVQIALLKGLPKLEVSFPQENQSFSKADSQITLKGNTDPDNSVSVNGFIAIVDGSGNFSYDIRLNNGENKLTITARGKSGQTTTKELTVSYSE